jgi:S-adenosylhomocysteine hydrolase
LIKIGSPLIAWERIAFVCVQHILPTTASVFYALVRLGVKPHNIYLLGKHYSTIYISKQQITKLGIHLFDNSIQTKLGYFSETFSLDISRLWHYVLRDLRQKNIDGIIIVDDGGYCLSQVPSELVNQYLVIGIEQTTSGLLNPSVSNLPFPLIEVASSAAKRWLEPPIISNSIIKGVSKILSLKEKRFSCGVVGFGAIGKALSNTLLGLGYKVTVYDKKLNKNIKDDWVQWANGIDKLVLDSDCIFGCTGNDIIDDIAIACLVKSNKFLISCSSGDKEFNSLLRFIEKTYHNRRQVGLSLADVIYKNKVESPILICRGGFPINFNNSVEAEPKQDIQLTRGLILSGILQAASILSSMGKNRHARFALEPSLQQLVAYKWEPYHTRHSYLQEILPYFKDINWVVKHSGGYVANRLFI